MFVHHNTVEAATKTSSLAPFYCTTCLVLGCSCLIASLVCVVKGGIYQPFPYTPRFASGTGTTFKTFTIFNGLPPIVFSAFNISFLSTEIYHRAMQPIKGMDSRGRAEESLLIDYISPIPPSSVFKAVKNKHFHIAWNLTLALVCTTVFVVPAGYLHIKMTGLNIHSHYPVGTSGALSQYSAYTVHQSLFAFLPKSPGPHNKSTRLWTSSHTVMTAASFAPLNFSSQ